MHLCIAWRIETLTNNDLTNWRLMNRRLTNWLYTNWRSVVCTTSSKRQSINSLTFILQNLKTGWFSSGRRTHQPVLMLHRQKLGTKAASFQDKPTKLVDKRYISRKGIDLFWLLILLFCVDQHDKRPVGKWISSVPTPWQMLFMSCST